MQVANPEGRDMISYQNHKGKDYKMYHNSVLYWLLGTSIRKIANFAFSSSLFACQVKLERGKSKDVLLALPDKNLKHTRKIGACFENALRKDAPKMGERASTGIFAHNSVLGYAPTTHYPIDSVCFSLGYQLVVMVQPSQDRNCNYLGSLVLRGTK